MRTVRVAPAAEGDIGSILSWTEETFGSRARARYAALVVQAISDLADDPDRPGVSDRPEIATGIRAYHLGHSKRRVQPAVGAVNSPRHFVLFREEEVPVIEIVRVLHDSMDISRHMSRPE